MTRTLTILLAFSAAAPCAASAQEAALPLTLEAALERGQRHSLRLVEMHSRVEAAEAAEAGRRAADRPLLAALGGYTRTNHVDEFTIVAPGQPTRTLYPDVPDNYRARLDLQWPIYSGGRADALVRAARAEAGAATAETAVTRADLRLEVSRVFWAVVTGRATVTVLEQAVSRAEANVADARARLTAGLVPPNEVASAE